jgi:hypothetical protein
VRTTLANTNSIVFKNVSITLCITYGLFLYIYVYITILVFHIVCSLFFWTVYFNNNNNNNNGYLLSATPTKSLVALCIYILSSIHPSIHPPIHCQTWSEGMGRITLQHCFHLLSMLLYCTKFLWCKCRHVSFSFMFPCFRKRLGFLLD